jgi:hypothetical protein
MEEIMPSMTDAMDRLAQSIARSRRARAEAAVPRSEHVHALLALHRRDRQALHRHQRRQLTAFMNDLTAKVGTLRAGFRAGLEGVRSTQPLELVAFVTNLSASVGTWRVSAQRGERRLAACITSWMQFDATAMRLATPGAVTR